MTDKPKTSLLDAALAVWLVAIVGALLWVGSCLVFATDYARAEFYAAWDNLASALIPVAPAIIAPWLLGLAVCVFAMMPFIVVADIKRKRQNDAN